MDNTSQRRALRACRSRSTQRGIARFAVIGLHADRALIRQLARRLTTNDPAATDMRSTVSRALASEESKTGGILAALRRAPHVGADLDLTRTHEGGRGTDL